MLKFPRSVVSTTLAIALLGLGHAVPAAAQTVQWRPGGTGSSAGGTLSGGRRGEAIATCQLPHATTPTRLSLLVPGSAADLLTTSARPTLAWTVQTPRPVSMTFTLSHPNQAQPIYTQTLQGNRSGRYRLTLPPSVNLETGVRYRWMVAIACGSGQNETYARSFIQRVAAVPTTGNALERAASYASLGIWYDALGSLLVGIEQTPRNARLESALQTLLQQARVIQP